MTRMVHCVKLGKEAEGMKFPPLQYFFGDGADAVQGYVPQEPK